MESAKNLSQNSHRLLLRNHTNPNHTNSINEDRIVFAIMIAVIASLGVIVFVIYKCFRQTSSEEDRTEVTLTPSIDTELDPIPVLVYGESVVPSSDTISETESCAICLEEYTNGELLRVLPKCKHMFHKICIEEWLSVPSLHCPICRDQILEHCLQSARSNNCRNQIHVVTNQFPLFAVYGGGIRNSFA